MSKTKLKIILWLVLVALLGFTFFAVFNGVSRLLLYFQQGADPGAALNIVPNVPPDLQVALDWLPDDPDTGREMEPFTRTEIESAYLRAWLQWNISYLRGEPYGLKTYFSGPALEAVTNNVLATHQQGWSLEQADLAHRLQLHFYAADGSIVSFTAHDVTTVQLMRDAAGAPIFSQVTEATYDVVMLLDDGNWRVRHWVRQEAEPLTAVEAAQAENGRFVQTKDNALWLDGEPFQMRGLNYYPQAAPWHDFWPSYDPAVITADFELMQQLGVNTIRIFVPHQPEPPEVEAEDEEAEPLEIDPYADLREKLTDLLDQAAAHELKVIVTLFDFRTDYQILLWPEADRELEEIVPHFADHPAILAWDLKNEPDLDQPGNSPEKVNTWLRHVARQVRQHDPNHLITIGWAHIDNAHQLADAVDFVSFHYYGLAEELGEKVAGLETAVSNKPIAMTEFGLPTWNSPFFPHGHTEQEQAAYYAALLRALNETESAGFVAWTLYDFEHIPADVVGRLPWRVAPQKHLGLINLEGNLKPAAGLLAEGANLDLPFPSPLARFLKPFWLTLVFGATLMSGLTYFSVRYIWRRRTVVDS